MLTSYTMTPEREMALRFDELIIAALAGFLPGRDAYLLRGLEAQLLDFVVVVLAVENVPLLRAFEDDLALRGDLLAGGSVDFGLFEEELFEGFAGFLSNGVAVFEEVALGDLGEGVGDGVGEFIELVAGDSHSTALYLRASSFFTFLNISG